MATAAHWQYDPAVVPLVAGRKVDTELVEEEEDDQGEL